MIRERDDAPRSNPLAVPWNLPRPRQRLVVFGTLLLVLAAVLAISFWVTPEDIERGRVWLSPVCLTRRWLGVDCPTCGLTRAFAALSHGQLALAWQYNCLAPLLYVMTWLGALLCSVGLVHALMALRRSRARRAP